MAGMDKQLIIQANHKGGILMSNKATDKAQTGKPDRGKNSPFKKKTPQSRA